MFDHVRVRVSDRAAAEHFYRTVLATLGLKPTHADERFVEWNDFSIAGSDGRTSPTRGLHIGFVASSREEVDEFWRVGTAAGYRDDGPPGSRPQYSEAYYGSFLLDPDGNSAEAVHHETLRTGGTVDHLWIRVADLAASRRFYRQVAPHADFRLVTDLPERARFAGASGSFSVLEGIPTQHLHMAFPVAHSTAVGAFFEKMMTAGYDSNGEPGERPDYPHGYYAAYVLDPDGNNIELVNHNRAA